MTGRNRRNRTTDGSVAMPALLLAVALVAASLLAARAPVAAAQSSCQLPPVTLPLFQATPAAVIAAPATPVAELTGRPLTEDEQAEVTQAVRIIVDCLNTGAPKEVWAIFTPRYLAARFTGPDAAYQPAFEQMIAENRVSPTEPRHPYTFKSVRDGVKLEDGRIAVTVDLRGLDASWHDRLVLAQVGTHWLIDAVASFDPATPPAA